MSTPYLSIHTGPQVDSAVLAAEALGVVGLYSIPDGQSGGVVTGLNLPFVPTKIQLTMQLPDTSDFLLIDAYPLGQLTQDGFEFILTGTTNSNQYVLHYHLAP